MSVCSDVEIGCPFCGNKVLWDYAGEDGDDFGTEFCEHTVYAYRWGVDVMDTHINTGDARLDARLGSIAENADRDSLADMVVRRLRRARRARDGWQFDTASEYAERGMGPRGGGPTYILVFAAQDDTARPSHSGDSLQK